MQRLGDAATTNEHGRVALNWPRYLPLLTIISLLMVACTSGERSAGETIQLATTAADTFAIAPTRLPPATETSEAPATRSSTKEYSRPGADDIKTMLRRDAIKAILEPEFLTVSEAEGIYQDQEVVIGVELAGEARAYSVGFLSGHEIVNDEVAGRKIAVTW